MLILLPFMPALCSLCRTTYYARNYASIIASSLVVASYCAILHPLQVLLQKASPSQAQDLLSSYKMLTSPEEMGERFKFMAITASDKHIPTPFSE